MESEDDVDLPRGIGRPATGAFRLAGYTRLEQFDGVPRRDVLALHAVGPKAVRILTEALAERGMALS